MEVTGMNRRSSALALPVALAACLSASAQMPDLAVDELADGPYARMHALLERTIFRVDVLTVDVRIDRPTQERFAMLAADRSYSDGLASRIADAAVEARDVFLEVTFLRDVSLSQWVDGARENLDHGRAAGLIQEGTYRDVMQNLPVWFAPVADRGFQERDRIRYRGYPDRLRTVLVDQAGRIWLDQTDIGAPYRRALLAGYFAPGAELREPLIRSLF
jgi:hypothetical protein